MSNIITIINFLMVIVKVVQYFFRKKKMAEKLIKNMERSFRIWGIDEADTPRKIKKSVKDKMEKMRKLVKKGEKG